MPFVILIGASGSGKTVVARTVASHYSRDLQVSHFDQIGVPSAQQMIAEYGSGEAWQRAKALEWIAKLASVVIATSGVLLEGKLAYRFLRKHRSDWKHQVYSDPDRLRRRDKRETLVA